MRLARRQNASTVQRLGDNGANQLLYRAHMGNHRRTEQRLSTVQSVDRAVTILELLAHQGALGVTELSRELSVHKSTAARLVGALLQRGLVEQIEDRGKYRLGAGILRLAGATTARLDLVQEARPICRDLSASTGETVNIAVLATNSALYIDQVTGHLSSSYNWVGQHIPLHATSNGKVLLSGLPEPEVTQLTRELPAYTPDTITSRTALATVLQEVRRHGYAVARNELDTGLTAVAAPIRNSHGEIVASVSVSGPTFRFGPLVADAIPTIKEAAGRISARLGAPPIGPSVPSATLAEGGPDLT